MTSFFGWLFRLLGGRSSVRPGPQRPAAASAPSAPRAGQGPPIATASGVKPRSASVENAEPLDLDLKAVRLSLVKRLTAMRSAATLDNDRMLLEFLEKAVIEGSLDLPRFPAVAEELLTLDTNDDIDGKQVADLIARDPDLAARIIQLASSVAFGGVRQTSLVQAVTRLGFSQVRYVAIGTSVGDVVYRVPGYDKEVSALRDAGFAAGVLGAKLARTTGRPGDSGLAFLAGLFHDIGQALVLRNLSMVRARTKGGAASHLLVKNLMSEIHVMLGTLYALDRNLPPAVVTAVAAHHEPSRAGEENTWLTFLVWAADQMQENAEHLSDKDKMTQLAEAWPKAAPALDVMLAAVRDTSEVRAA